MRLVVWCERDIHSPALPGLNYFQCHQMLETLKTLDGEGKSLFGKYNSPRVQVAAHALDSSRNYESFVLAHRPIIDGTVCRQIRFNHAVGKAH